MVTIICSESNIEFEAETRRTKQHPLIAQLKARANKDRTYREANDALMAVRKAGGYETIDEFMALVEQHMQAAYDKHTERINRQAEAARQAKVAAEARKNARREQNEHLRAHGYKWALVTVEFGDRDDDDVKEWFLYGPDGNEVSLEQALAEIEHGVDVAKAAQEAKAAQAAEAARAEAAAAAEKEAADQSAYAAFDEQADAIRTGYQRVERFAHDWNNREILYRMGYVSTSYRRHDYIFKFEYNGHTVYCVVAGSGYDDNGYTEYYTADPEAAGLTVMQAETKRQRYSDFF